MNTFFFTEISANDLNILHEDENELTIELLLPNFELQKDYIQISGWAFMTQIGSPELPIKSLLLKTPQSSTIKIEIIQNDNYKISNCYIKPVQPLTRVSPIFENDEIINEFKFDKAIYNSVKFYPGKLAEIESQGFFRGTPFARLMIYPFQWNPTTKELIYSKRLIFKVSFKKKINNTSYFINNMNSFNNIYDQIKENLFINKENLLKNNAASIIKDKSSQSEDFKEGLKIIIKKEGIYRLTYDDLKTIGIELSSIDPKTFQIFNQGNEIAIKVISLKEQFGEGDYIEFFSTKIDNQYTDTNVYWLYWNNNYGKRIESIDGKITGQGKKVDTFYETLHFEENHTIWESTPGSPDKDYWFWEKMNGNVTKNYTISVPSPLNDSSQALMRVHFQGCSTASSHPNHHTIISMNNISMGNNFWDGDKEYIQEASFSVNNLINGNNTLTIKSPADTGASVDVIYYNWIELNYWRVMKANQDLLNFIIEGDDKIEARVSGFSQSDVKIYDITDPLYVKEILNAQIENTEGAYKCIFEDQIETKKQFYVIGSSNIEKPSEISLWRSENLKSESNSADYIVISPKEFLSSIQPLCDFRQNQGLRIKKAAIEDIYNEFNYGIFDPKAIKDFLKYTYQNWAKPAPTFVLLAGDANTDYRDYFGTGKKTKIPAHLTYFSDSGLRPDDNWYVCLEGDDPLTEMMLGRIPGKDNDTISQIVNKMITFEDIKKKPKSVLLAADNDEISFENLCENLIPHIPSDYTIDKVYLRLYQDADDATQDILSNMDKGNLISNYVGHGNIKIWSGEPLFESSNVNSLKNNGNKLTFVISMSCLNGYFSHPNYYCLSEELIAAKDKGALACLSSSGSSYQSENEVFNKEIFSVIFNNKNYTIGSIVADSKSAAYSKGVSYESILIFHLLGDPASQLMEKENSTSSTTTSISTTTMSSSSTTTSELTTSVITSTISSTTSQPTSSVEQQSNDNKSGGGGGCFISIAINSKIF
ncbi:MAG: hypothetical protein HQK79_08455 [Desulfobacterales bacterium]|nr:hypothetical protein [Desulfobacterales bacterium]